jgi:large subunit ribosomal protein L4
MKLDVKSVAGAGAGSVDVPDDLFGIKPNVAVMHQVVTAQLAAARSGTHSTKTRAEVAGGGAKPWRQKGTGRARQGSIRSPQWRGGGIAHGPKPRNYRQRTPKKMIRLALRSALSDRAAEGKVVVVDDWAMTTPRTKDALAALGALGLRTKGERDDRVLIVVDSPTDENSEEAVWKSFRNLGDRVRLVLPRELNTYDVLVSDWLVFSKATLDAAVAHFGGSSAEATTASVTESSVEITSESSPDPEPGATPDTGADEE